jgi:hypothetical protein
MKQILILLTFLISITAKSQSSAIVYVPIDYSVIGIYKPNQKTGFYLGGRYVFSVPAQYSYTTPYSYVNRFGVDVSLKCGTSLMGGGCFTDAPSFINTKFIPELWVRSNLVQLFTNKDKDLDLTLMARISKEFYYGLGLNYPL